MTTSTGAEPPTEDQVEGLLLLMTHKWVTLDMRIISQNKKKVKAWDSFKRPFGKTPKSQEMFIYEVTVYVRAVGKIFEVISPKNFQNDGSVCRIMEIKRFADGVSIPCVEVTDGNSSTKIRVVPKSELLVHGFAAFMGGERDKTKIDSSILMKEMLLLPLANVVTGVTDDACLTGLVGETKIRLVQDSIAVRDGFSLALAYNPELGSNRVYLVRIYKEHPRTATRVELGGGDDTGDTNDIGSEMDALVYTFMYPVEDTDVPCAQMKVGDSTESVYLQPVKFFYTKNLLKKTPQNITRTPREEQMLVQQRILSTTMYIRHSTKSSLRILKLGSTNLQNQEHGRPLNATVAMVCLSPFTEDDLANPDKHLFKILVFSPLPSTAIGALFELWSYHNHFGFIKPPENVTCKGRLLRMRPISLLTTAEKGEILQLAQPHVEQAPSGADDTLDSSADADTPGSEGHQHALDLLAIAASADADTPSPHDRAVSALSRLSRPAAIAPRVSRPANVAVGAGGAVGEGAGREDRMFKPAGPAVDSDSSATVTDSLATLATVTDSSATVTDSETVTDLDAAVRRQSATGNLSKVDDDRVDDMWIEGKQTAYATIPFLPNKALAKPQLMELRQNIQLDPSTERGRAAIPHEHKRFLDCEEIADVASAYHISDPGIAIVQMSHDIRSYPHEFWQIDGTEIFDGDNDFKRYQVYIILVDNHYFVMTTIQLRPAARDWFQHVQVQQRKRFKVPNKHGTHDDVGTALSVTQFYRALWRIPKTVDADLTVD